MILLGIGFIMLAAMFPVAIRQTQTTLEETAGSWLSQGAVKTVQQAASGSLLPPTGPPGTPGKVATFRDRAILGDAGANALWQTISGNLILTQDPRYAWIPMYRRNDGDNFAQLILIGVTCRNRPNFATAVDVPRWKAGAIDDTLNNPSLATLEPREIDVVITQGANDAIPDTVVVSGADKNAVAENTYVVIRDDTTNAGKTNGYVYRIGNRISGDTWELQPGNDLKGSAITGISGKALIVGRGWADPRNPGIYEGPAQDVAAYPTFIRLN